MQSIKKFAAIALYLLLLLGLLYGATLLVFILAVWLPTSSLVLFILGIVIGIASGYLFFQASERFAWRLVWPLAPATLRNIAVTAFAVSGLLFSLVAASLVLLMQRSGEYLPEHIAQAVAPPLVWIALCMGIVVAGRLMNRT